MDTTVWWKPLENVAAALGAWWWHLQELDNDDEDGEDEDDDDKPPKPIPPVTPGVYDTLADAFAEHLGVVEYNGIVATIQMWYYGSVVKASWCATSVSYFSNQLGILAQIGGKNENVNRMRLACLKANPDRCVTDRSILKSSFAIVRGDILFWLWEGDTMSDGSNKHVGVANEESVNSRTVACIGGNQSDMIKVAIYDRKSLYMVFRPDYRGASQE